MTNLEIEVKEAGLSFGLNGLCYYKVRYRQRSSGVHLLEPDEYVWPEIQLMHWRT